MARVGRGAGGVIPEATSGYDTLQRSIWEQIGRFLLEPAFNIPFALARWFPVAAKGLHAAGIAAKAGETGVLLSRCLPATSAFPKHRQRPVAAFGGRSAASDHREIWRGSFPKQALE